MKGFSIHKLSRNFKVLDFSMKISGFKYSSKYTKDLEIKDVEIYSQKIVEKMLLTNFNKRYKQILELYLSVLVEINEGGSTGTKFMIALDEIARLRSILIRKYHYLLEKEVEEEMLKKLKILENEIRTKIIDFNIIREHEATKIKTEEIEENEEKCKAR